MVPLASSLCPSGFSPVVRERAMVLRGRFYRPPHQQEGRALQVVVDLLEERQCSWIVARTADTVEQVEEELLDACTGLRHAGLVLALFGVRGQVDALVVGLALVLHRPRPRDSRPALVASR